MRVLFICRAKNDTGIVSFVKSQADSLSKHSVNVEFFTIKGSGIFNYVKAVFELKDFLKSNKYDILHAHYTFSGWVAVLASCRIPIVLSLMGTDAYGQFIGENRIKFNSNIIKLLTLLIQPFVKIIISKSANIEKVVYLKYKSHIIPNGVNIDVFHDKLSINRSEFLLRSDIQYALFLGDPKNPRKNFKLAYDAIKLLNDPKIELLSPYPVNQDDVVNYFNLADVFLMPAFMEGSPNVIKEAMACNCPIVATNVGDTNWVIGNTTGCIISSFDKFEFANAIVKALEFSKEHKRTNGRDRIRLIGLDTNSIAVKIISTYRLALGAIP